jgi:hypothetical protein
LRVEKPPTPAKGAGGFRCVISRRGAGEGNEDTQVTGISNGTNSKDGMSKDHLKNGMSK